MDELELERAVSKPDELAEDNPGLPRDAFDLRTALALPFPGPLYPGLRVNPGLPVITSSPGDL